MSVVRSRDALDILTEAYASADGTTVPKRWDLRAEQVDMIRQLSERYSESQVSILRAIVDEWREMKLAGAA